MFTDIGQLHTVKVSDIPMGKLKDKGIPVDNISSYTSMNEQILMIASQSELNLYRLVFVTKKALCKIVSGGEFDVSRRMIASTKLNDGDTIVNVGIVKDTKNIVLVSTDGFFIRFPLEELSELKKTAAGVRGMKLSDSADVEAVYYENIDSEPNFTFRDKQIEYSKIKLSKRDGKGTKLRLG